MVLDRMSDAKESDAEP
jgi:hypothetical protein